MKRCRFNKLISLYLDKEISPEELHELNQELERSESSRKRFKSAIVFNQLLKKQESFAEEITSVKTVAFTRYAKWGAGGFAALLLVTFSCFQVFNSSIEVEEVERPVTVRMETKTPLKKSLHERLLQANFRPMNWENLKKDLQNDSDEMLFLRRQSLSKRQFDGFSNVKLTQVSMPTQR